MASIVEENPLAKDLDDYINNILMKMNEDAQGFLLNVVPIVLRINIFIVNIDTSPAAKVMIWNLYFREIKVAKKLRLRNANAFLKIFR